MYAVNYEQLSITYLKGYKKTQANDYLLKLYNLHKGLFKAIIKRYTFLMDQEDLLQECYFSLIKAVEEYQEEKGSFIKYLASTTNNHLYRSIKKQNGDFPEYMQPLIKKYLSLLDSFKDQGINPPEDNMIALMLNISIETLHSIYKAISIKNCISLNAPIDEEGATLEDITTSDYNLEENCIDNLFTEEVKDRVHQCINELSETDQELIRKKYIDGMSLSEIDPDRSISANKQKVDKAFRRLQRIGKIKLAAINEEYVYTKGLKRTGLTYFKNTGTSSIEAIIIESESVHGNE